MAVAEDGGNAKSMRDAEEEVYDRDGGIIIDGKAAKDMNYAGRFERAKVVGFTRNVVWRRKMGRCDLTRTRVMMETSAELENVAYDQIDTENTRSTDHRIMGDAPTPTLQPMRTARRT